MIILDGKTLGARQKQLNVKVNDAAKNNANFKVVEEQVEKSDVDKLFKIDLAAKYKNVGYVIEILKGGDYFYITRALSKCLWLYDNKFNHIVNPDFLSKEIFPFMSIKMRNRLMTAIATNLQNDEARSVDFFAYCIKIKLHNIALKFLIGTSETYKLEVIVKKTIVLTLIADKEGDYLVNFIGDSFELAENYVKNLNFYSQKCTAIYLLRHLYSISNEKYLNLLETCHDSQHILGRRISKNIIQNHKSRVMKCPKLYANVLNIDVIKRNCKVDEAKILVIALLPDTPAQFYRRYPTFSKFILKLIPAVERFSFVKKIFHEKYVDEPFETSVEFYSKNIFEIMTIDEREYWALQNIASNNEIIFGRGNDYKWYKFVNFEKAFSELRKEIVRTPDNYKRGELLTSLMDSAKNEEELAKLLNYYYERHRNEDRRVTDRILNKLINKSGIWHFSETTWNALEIIFYGIDVFNRSKDNNESYQYRAIALMYYIINEKTVPEVLNEFIEGDLISFHTLSRNTRDLKEESEKDAIFQYMLQYYTERIKVLISVTREENENSKKITKYVDRILGIAIDCDKTKNDITDILLTHVKQFWTEFARHRLFADHKLSSIDIVNYLKKDPTLVVTNFPQIKVYCESNFSNINWLVHKLKVYFSHDIAEKYLQLFEEYLQDDSLLHRTITVNIAVRGVLVLADQNHKIDFLQKYTPTHKNMDKATVSHRILSIQEAICRQMLASRPLLPLDNVFQFITGDYVHYCLVLFHSLFVNLPQPQSREFIQKMINSPISIQKHGLRLAFESDDTEQLLQIVQDSWKKTKNVSLRMVLYKSLCMKVSSEIGDTRLKLFDVLITLTTDLNEHDDEALKLIETVKLPDCLVGRFFEAVWIMVSKFPEKPTNFGRLKNIIDKMIQRLCLIPEECVDKIIKDHINFMFVEGQIKNDKFDQDFLHLLRSKWDLTISSIVYMPNERKLEKNLNLAKRILKHCVEMWNELNENSNKLVAREFFKKFITALDDKSYNDVRSYSYCVTLLQAVNDALQKALPEKEVYLLVWKLHSNIVTKKVLLESNVSPKTMKLEDIKEPGIKLGKDFGILVKTTTNKGRFYRIFCSCIEDIATTAVDNFQGFYNRYDLFTSTDILILFCLGLLETKIFETYMMALNLLPTEYDGKFMEAYLGAIKELQTYQNTEIEFYMYEKFVNTDFKKKKYI